MIIHEKWVTETSLFQEAKAENSNKEDFKRGLTSRKAEKEILLGEKNEYFNYFWALSWSGSNFPPLPTPTILPPQTIFCRFINVLKAPLLSGLVYLDQSYFSIIGFDIKDKASSLFIRIYNKIPTKFLAETKLLRNPWEKAGIWLALRIQFWFRKLW